jgi:hypothetical protein
MSGGAAMGKGGQGGTTFGGAMDAGQTGGKSVSGGTLAAGGSGLGGITPAGGTMVNSGGVQSSGGSVAGGSNAGGTVNTGGLASSGGASGLGGIASTGGANGQGGGTGKAKLRVVMSTDFPPLDVCMGGCAADHRSDPDDVQSMVRFLLYSNEFDIEGLIASAATFAGKAKKQNILDMIDLYEKVYSNLKTHGDYPAPDALRAVTFQGRDGTWGGSTSKNIGEGKDSEASDALIAIIDKPDPRPVYIGVWGDCSQVAQAIWKVQKTRSPEELDKFISKIRIHQIARQDETIEWLLNTFPKLFIVWSKSTYIGVMSGDLAWVNTNIRNNHGPLCAAYPPAAISGSGVIEGDSPSFLILVSANRGLNDPEDPTQESWGGQFKRDGSTNHYLDGPGGGSISKWRSKFLPEFAERADWCVQ